MVFLFLLVALILFVISIFWSPPGISFASLGLAFLTLAFLVPHLPN